jgi:Ribbon-helix-helix protein, copG family
MDRINVYAYPADWDSASERTLAGWFDMGKADRWDDADYDGNGSRGPGRGTAIIRTAQGRWVKSGWTNWQNETSTYEYVTAEQAEEWLLRNGFDAVLEEHFGEIEEERGPGRPVVGDAINVRLGDELLGRVDALSAGTGISRAEAIRSLVTVGLAATAY